MYACLVYPCTFTLFTCVYSFYTISLILYPLYTYTVPELDGPHGQRPGGTDGVRREDRGLLTHATGTYIAYNTCVYIVYVALRLKF